MEKLSPRRPASLWKRLAIATPIGLALYGAVFWVAVPAFPAVLMRMRNETVSCTWDRLLRLGVDNLRYENTRTEILKTLRVIEEDPQLGAVRISTAGRSFWYPKSDPTHGLANQMAEQEWFTRMNPENVVRPGDVVVDCGGNVGIYADMALRRGAAKVITIEPAPANVECLRRNLAPEIAAGKVIVVAKAVWSKPGELELMIGNSHATHSLVQRDGEATRSVKVPVDTLDNILRELGVGRITYLKMDIEGAEREALKGAMATLRRDRPRIMLDSYHRPDDMDVLPGVVRAAHGDYRLICGPCSVNPNVAKLTLVPHVTYYE